MIGQTAAICAKIPLYRAFRAHGRPALMPLSMSFVTTDRCNSVCKTCNIGKRYLDDPTVAEGELTLDEYTALFRSIRRLTWVTFSGGEPFMRPDFPEIVARLAEIVKPRAINIPTNATLVRATSQGIKKILSRLGQRALIVNFSVDGVGAKHDEVRGFAGNFALFERTIDELRRIDDPRLVIGVNTVLSRFNIADADTIFDYVLERVVPDSYVVEVAQIRPEYYNQGDSIAPVAEETARAIDRFLEKSRAHERRGIPRWVSAFRRKYYADVQRELVDARGHECYSAFGTCSVMPKGEVWSNTQRADLLGNVRDFGLDFPALWFSPGADRVRETIRRERCHCETSNVAYMNSLMNLGELPKLFYYYVRGA